MSRIKLGSRASTEAWRFDRTCNNEKDRWSYSIFGENWGDGRVCGIVLSKEGEKWRVKWDLDNEESTWETQFLHKESGNVPPQLHVEKPSGLLFC